MRLLGAVVKGRELAVEVMKGFAGAVGAVLLSAIVVVAIYVWYRVTCKRNGTCVSSVVQSALAYRPSSAVASSIATAGTGTNAGTNANEEAGQQPWV